jgi:hypothetical protein
MVKYARLMRAGIGRVRETTQARGGGNRRELGGALIERIGQRGNAVQGGILDLGIDVSLPALEGFRLFGGRALAKFENRVLDRVGDVLRSEQFDRIKLEMHFGLDLEQRGDRHLLRRAQLGLERGLKGGLLLRQGRSKARRFRRGGDNSISEGQRAYRRPGLGGDCDLQSACKYEHSKQDGANGRHWLLLIIVCATACLWAHNTSDQRQSGCCQFEHASGSRRRRRHGKDNAFGGCGMSMSAGLAAGMSILDFTCKVCLILDSAFCTVNGCLDRV